MNGPSRLMAVGLLWGTIWALGGCSEKCPIRTECPVVRNVLLGSERSSSVATQIGRSDWPSTDGRFELPEQTYYVEYYQDFQSSFQNEQNTPYRNFQSYRVGASSRWP